MRVLIFILVFAVATFVASAGMAGGFYIEPGVGLNWLDQESGHPQPADTGFHLSLVGGYRFHRRWAVEFHTGFLRNVLPEARSQSGVLYAEQTAKQYPLIPNLVFHFTNDSRFEPYVGSGPGVVVYAGEDETGGDVGFEFMAGVRYRLKESMLLGLSYRFIMVLVGSAIAEEPVGNDSVNLSLKWEL